MNKNLALRQLINRQIFQDLKASLAIYTYEMKEVKNRELFFQVFLPRTLPVTLLHDAYFLQLLFDNNLAKARMPYEMSMPTISEAQPYFHKIILMSGGVGKKDLKIIRSVVNSTREDRKVHLLQKAWNLLRRPCSLRPLWFVIKPYMWFKPGMIQFQVLLP